MNGQLIDDRYRVESLLGRGGMGTVYRATDLAKDQTVALKMLHLYLDKENEVAFTRFHREFRILAHLDHARIVRAYQHGTHVGVPYLTLEFLEGRTLDMEMASGSFSRPELLDVARQLCEALIYLHNQSIVHRDLKPGNLMLLPASNGDGPHYTQLKLMDFGLVRQTDMSMQLTQEGVALGTVAYMAPEQAQGLPVDFRADLYALGIILYEMAAGRPPFSNQNPAAVLMQQLTTIPPSPRQFNPDVDDALEALILGLLTKEPSGRPNSTEQVASHLARLADESAPVVNTCRKRADLIPRMPLIGRELPLLTLTQHWNTAQSGQGQVVFLAGLAGVGKTRFLMDVGLQIKLGNNRVVSSGCREQAALPYQPLIEVISKLLRSLPSSVAEDLPVELARLIPDLVVNETDDLPVADQAEARLRLFAGFWGVLYRAAQEKPLFIVIEDLQWCDQTTMELIGYLAQRTAQAQILLVLTYRPEEVSEDSPLSRLQQDLVRLAGVHLLALELLSSEQVADFLHAALGQDRVPAWVIENFYQATNGNPLFIEETLKALAAEGQVAEWTNSQVDEQSSQTRHLSSMTLQLPKNVLALAERRLQLLSAEDRTILTAAAVLGPEFSFALLEEVARTDEDSLLDAIDRLLAARLIDELPLQDGDDRYRFAQEAIRQALLDTISQRRRRILHQRAGDAIERLYQAGQERYLPALAYHCAQSGDTPRAVRYCTLAGDAAAQMYANAEAIAIYSHALEIVVTGPAPDDIADSDQLKHLYLSRGRSLELSGRYDEALQNYNEMESIARDRQDQAVQLEALMASATIRSTMTPVHDPAQGQALAEQALQLAHALNNPNAESKGLWLLMWTMVSYERPAQAVEYGEQSLALARQHNLRERMAFALNDLQYSYQSTGQLGRGLEALDEARGLWRELNNMPMLSDNLGRSALAYYLSGDFESSLRVAEEAYQISKSINNSWGLGFSRMMNGPILLEQGLPDEAIRVMEDTMVLVDDSGLLPIVSLAVQANLAWLYGQMGQAEKGLELAERALARIQDDPNKMQDSFRSVAKGTLARLYILTGDLDQAEKTLKESYTDLNLDEPVTFALVWITAAEAELAFARHDYERVISIMDKYIDHLETYGVYPWRPEALFFKSEALRAEEREDEAYQVLVAARSSAESLGSKRMLWAILFSLSRLEAQRGNLDKAEELHQEARQVIDFIIAHTPLDLRDSFLAQTQVREILETV